MDSWVDIELSEEILMNELQLGSFELFSSRVKEFEIFGSQKCVCTMDAQMLHVYVGSYASCLVRTPLIGGVAVAVAVVGVVLFLLLQIPLQTPTL